MILSLKKLVLLSCFMPLSVSAMNSQRVVRLMAAVRNQSTIFSRVARSPLAPSLLYGETLFYKKNKSPLTDSEAQSVYATQRKNQFPQCLKHGNGRVPLDEIAAMQKGLNLTAPDVVAAFIPTTLYELLFIKYYKFDRNARKFNQQPFYPKTECAYDADYRDAQGEKVIQEMHQDFNEYLVNFCAQKGIDFKTMTQWQWRLFAPEIIDEMDCMSKESKWNPDSTQFIRRAYVIDAAIKQECKAQARNDFLLYRDAGSIEKRPIRNNQSLSYGNTLFNGYFGGDRRCPFKLICEYSKPYTLPINKWHYVHGPLKHMFYISPLSTIENMFTYGHLDFSRSKIKHDQPIDGPEDRLGLRQGNENVKEATEKYLMIKNQDPEGTYQNIFKYVANNHRLIQKSKRF